MLDAWTVLPHEVDHIQSLKHHGATALNNLSWSCALCNSFKGSNPAGYDSDTRKLSRLFHPRTDSWAEHFIWNGPTLHGMTPVGRATIDVLRINAKPVSNIDGC
jgi:hypothetical protein